MNIIECTRSAVAKLHNVIKTLRSREELRSRIAKMEKLCVIVKDLQSIIEKLRSKINRSRNAIEKLCSTVKNSQIKIGKSCGKIQKLHGESSEVRRA